MKLSKLLLLTSLTILTSVFSQAQYSDAPMTTPKEVQEKSQDEENTNWSQQNAGDIVDIAASDKRFSTLVAAVKAAELVATLKSEGPFTVFAPTNAAFNKLPKGTVDNLLKPKNKQQLQAVLTYHVVAGQVSATDIIDSIKRNGGGFMTETVQGDRLYARIQDGKVILTDAQGRESVVTATDIDASNGVIHIIDSVILPKS